MNQKHFEWMQQYSGKELKYASGKNGKILTKWNDSSYDQNQYSNEINLIQIPPDMIVLEYDCDPKKASEFISKTIITLKECVLKFGVYFWSGGRSPRIHIFLNKGATKVQKELILKKFAVDDSVDLSLAVENKLMPVPYSKHWKHNTDVLLMLSNDGNLLNVDDFKVEPKSDSRKIEGTTIIDIAKSFGLGVNNNNQALCPFHKDTEPSLTFYPENNSFFCFGCKESGDIAWFVRKIKGIKRTKEQKLPNVVWEDEIDSLDIPEVSWHIQSLIPKKSITLLVGKRNVFKSFNAIYTGLCLINGTSVYGHFETEACNVLFIDEENGFSIIKDRRNLIKKGYKFEHTNYRMGFLSFTNFKILNKKWLDYLTQIIVDNKISIIIVDSLIRILDIEENDAGEINRLFTDIFRPICERHNVSWVLLHHLRKGLIGKVVDQLDEIRGSSDIVNYADTVLFLERIKNSDKLVIKQLKNRFKEQLKPISVSLNFNGDFITFEFLGEPKEAILKESECMDCIIEFFVLENPDEVKRDKLVVAMVGKGYSESTTKNALTNLKASGKLTQPRRGYYCISKQKQQKLKLGGD